MEVNNKKDEHFIKCMKPPLNPNVFIGIVDKLLCFPQRTQQRYYFDLMSVHQSMVTNVLATVGL